MRKKGDVREKMEKKREANFIKKDNFCLFCGERHIRGGRGKKHTKKR